MALSTPKVKARADTIVGAWEESTVAAPLTINQHTIASFKALQAVVNAKEEKITAAEAKATALSNELKAAVEALNEACTDVVNGVRGNKELGGANGSLYEAMGYVRQDERKSGLTRKRKSPPDDKK